MMLRKILYACCVMVFIGTSMATQPVEAASGEPSASAAAVPAPATIATTVEVVARSYRLPEGTPNHSVVYNTSTGTGGIAAGLTPEGFDNPVYANEPPPVFIFPPGPNRLIADDLITVAVGGCSVSGYELKVGRSANRCSLTGAACSTVDDCSGTTQTCDPRPDAGFGVEFALYDACPGLGGQIIPGTEGSASFTENGLFTILVDFGGNNIAVDSTIWLGVSFDTSGAGWVVGTPAAIGFTENVYHHPVIPCAARFTQGSALYAGYHARVFCSATPPFEREFLAYFNPELNGGPFIPGGGQWIADDVTLIVEDCLMTSYEIGSTGGAPYTVTAEIWRFCSQATSVPGTQGVFQAAGGGLPELARFSFPEGIQLNNGANYWVAWKYSNNSAAILAGDPTLGESGNIFGLPGIGCGFWFGGVPIASFSVTIRCLGDAPTGACCDLAAVPAAGTTPLCREVTQIACSGALTRYNQGAKCPLTCDIDGTVCSVALPCGPVCSISATACLLDSDCPTGELCSPQTCLDLGVAFTPACSTSACCTPPENPNGGEGCFDLPRDECLAITDANLNSAVWQRGQFCGEPEQTCFLWQCRFAEGACDQPHATGGCNNPSCCNDICTQDGFCCAVEWDSTCVNQVANGGCTFPASNEVCFDPTPGLGAVFVDVSTMVCGNNGNPCTTSDDCGPGTCLLPSVLMNTDAAVTTDDETFCCANTSFGAVWAKFVAPDSSILLTTHTSLGNSDDPIIQVFRADDPTNDESACGSLLPIGCDDDSGSPLGQARLSLDNLTPGETYYVLLAASGGDTSGTYKIKFRSPSPDAAPANNACSGAESASPGQSLPFDLSLATLGCPAVTAACLVVPGIPNPPNPTFMDNDVWFSYEVGGNGFVTIDTCGADAGSTQDTTMVIYEGGTCPPDTSTEVACSHDAGGACGTGSSATFSVTSFETYLVRIGGVDGSEPTGMVNFGAVIPDCQQNLIADADEIACGAGNFCGGTCDLTGASCGVDADCAAGNVCNGAYAGADDCNNNLNPDECDIGLGISQDCNANGIPDECDGGCTSITIASSVPPNGEIDARQPTSLDGTVTFGWDSVVLTFDNDASAVTTGDLAVASTSGVAPTISAINTVGTDVTVTLSGPIPPGAWTTITYSPDGSSICLGFNPGDVNADGVAGPSDILAVIDSLNGVSPRPIFATDADRGGVAGPEDILRVIDLLNGAGSLGVWLDSAIGASPCP